MKRIILTSNYWYRRNLKKIDIIQECICLQYNVTYIAKKWKRQKNYYVS